MQLILELRYYYLFLSGPFWPDLVETWMRIYGLDLHISNNMKRFLDNNRMIGFAFHVFHFWHVVDCNTFNFRPQALLLSSLSLFQSASGQTLSKAVDM